MEQESFKNMRILVVGGAGFIGTNLVKLLLKKGVKKISIIDNLLSSEKENIPKNPNIKFIYGSIENNNILKIIKDEFDYIYHLATFHGNQNSIFDPLEDHKNNTLTTLKLFNKIKDFRNLKRIIYSSAGCSVAKKTFIDVKATTENESIEINQDSPYSISKLIGEFYSVYFHKQFNLPVVRARFQNVYGPGEMLGAGRWRGTPATVWRNVIPTFIYKAIKGEQLPVEGDGSSSRDFIFVEDICIGLISCAIKGKAGDVYNLASGIETNIANLAYLINKITNNKAGIRYLPGRNWDNSGRRFGSTTKSESNLGFKAKVGLEEGLEKTIDWTKENLVFIDSLINKHKKRIESYRNFII